MESLHGQAWADVSRYLDPASCYSLAQTCMHLHASITSNSILWRQQAEQRWPGLSPEVGSVIRDWHAFYTAAHKASHQLSAQLPWSASVTHPDFLEATAEQLLLVDDAPDVADTISSCCSSTHSPSWLPPTSVAACMSGCLHWWRWPAPNSNHRSSNSSCCEAGSDSDDDEPSTAHTHGARPFSRQGPRGRGRFPDTAAAVAAGRSAQHWYSESSLGTVTAMIQVPTGSCKAGFATGCASGIIKLWTPFTAQQGPVRPVRTLHGHKKAVSVLSCMPLPGSAPASCPPDSSSSSSSSSKCGGGAALLVSGSADTTIKLWSLSAVQAAAAGAARPGTSRWHQQGREPLLATLHGHSDSITSLVTVLPGVPGSCDDSSSSSSCVLSCSRDQRVKCWEVAEARRCCVSTWNMGEACVRLHGGLDAPGCVVVQLGKCLKVLDTRVRPTGSGVSRGVLSLSLPSHITASAACGSSVAAATRGRVQAWDMRAACSSSSSSSGSSSGSAQLLLSETVSRAATVGHLHLDRTKLVASVKQSQLGVDAGIAAWSLDTCHRVDLPASCLSGLSLHPQHRPCERVSLAPGLTGDDGPLHALQLAALTVPPAQRSTAAGMVGAAAVAVMFGNLGPADSDDSDATDDALDGGGGGEGLQLLGSDTQPDSSEGDDGVDGSDAEDGVEHGAGAGAGHSSTLGSSAGRYCLELGVQAMAVRGPVLASIDVLGNIFVRDFTAGLPSKHLLLNCAAASASGPASASVHSSAAPEAQHCLGSAVALHPMAATGATDAAAAPTPSRFWQS